MGTNNEELRNDPMYLGLKKPRITGQEYYDIIDEVCEWCRCVVEPSDWLQCGTAAGLQWGVCNLSKDECVTMRRMEIDPNYDL